MDERSDKDRTRIAAEMHDEGTEGYDEESDELTIDHMREVKEFYAEIKDQKVSPVAKNYQTLRLDLADTGLKKSDVTAVIEKLKTGRSFQKAELYLLGCKLTDDLLFSLLECLLSQAKGTLKDLELDLRDNSLTSNSLPMLLEVLGAFDKLETFKADLSDNQLLGKQDQFSHVTYASPRLRFMRVNLENTNTGNVVLDRFFASLGGFPNLHTLVVNLSGCRLCPVTRMSVEHLVRSSLVNLDICANDTHSAAVGELAGCLSDLCSRFQKNLSISLSGCGDVAQAPGWSGLDEEPCGSEPREGEFTVGLSGQSTMTSTMMVGEERSAHPSDQNDNLEKLLAEEPDEDLREVIRECIKRKAAANGRSAQTQSSPVGKGISMRDESTSKKSASGVKLQRVVNVKGTKLAGFQGAVVRSFETRHNVKVVR